MRTRICGSGSALPKLEVTNDDLSKIMDTSDEWIKSRTGICSRHLATDETLSSLAADAALQALEEAGIAPEELDMILAATLSADRLLPTLSCELQQRLGAGKAVAFDINAACSGFLFALQTADVYIKSGQYQKILVVGGEILSKLMDWEDRSTCVLFGDGAGAVVLEWREGEPGVLSSFLRNTDDLDGVLAVGNAFDMTTFPFGGPVEAAGTHSVAMAPFGGRAVATLGEAPAEGGEGGASPFIVMDGPAVFKFASNAMAEAACVVLERAGLAIDDVKCIVPHQANERIIKYAAKKLGVGLDRFQVSLASVGNTSASSVLMALADAYLAGRIEPGDAVMLVGFGGGLTSGALLYRA